MAPFLVIFVHFCILLQIDVKIPIDDDHPFMVRVMTTLIPWGIGSAKPYRAAQSVRHRVSETENHSTTEIRHVKRRHDARRNDAVGCDAVWWRVAPGDAGAAG